MPIISINERQIKNGTLDELLIGKKDWQNISSIYITGIRGLKTINANQLPTNLTTLSLSSCSNLESIETPQSLTALVLNQCVGLKKLLISKSTKLRILNLENCEQIEWNDDLKEQLNLLEDEGCKITYPNNYPYFGQKALRQDVINRANAKIEELNTAETAALYQLFNLYFLGNLGLEQSKLTRCQNIISLLDAINLDQKKFLNQVAKDFSLDDMDDNKNAAVFFQIANWIEASQQQDETKKSEALIPLMVYQKIANFVENLLQEEGVDDSFDKHLLINAFLREIHKNFHQNPHQNLNKNNKINANWIGIPQLLFQKKIAQSSMNVFEQFTNISQNPIEEKLQKFLTPKNLDLAFKMAEEILKNPMEKNIDEFFANKENIKIWDKIAFPVKYERIENERIDSLTSLHDANDERWSKSLKISNSEKGFFNEKITLTKNLIPKLVPCNSPSSKQRSASYGFETLNLKDNQRPRGYKI